MEGLASFVSSFENQNMEACRPSTQEALVAGERGRKDFMPSNTTASNLLPFSIEEILRDRESIHDPVHEPRRSNIDLDVGSKQNYDFPYEGRC